MKKTLITLFALTALFISTGLTMAEDEAAPEKGAAPEEVVETKADKAETDKAEDAVEEKGGDAKKADDDAGEEAVLPTGATNEIGLAAAQQLPAVLRLAKFNRNRLSPGDLAKRQRPCE